MLKYFKTIERTHDCALSQHCQQASTCKCDCIMSQALIFPSFVKQSLVKQWTSTKFNLASAPTEEKAWQYKININLNYDIPRRLLWSPWFDLLSNNISCNKPFQYTLTDCSDTTIGMCWRWRYSTAWNCINCSFFPSFWAWWFFFCCRWWGSSFWLLSPSFVCSTRAGCILRCIWQFIFK